MFQDYISFEFHVVFYHNARKIACSYAQNIDFDFKMC